MNETKNQLLRLVRKEDAFLLAKIGAKKGEIKSREDLKRFYFTCSCCKEIKNASEAILLMFPLDINLKNENDEIYGKVSQKMGLICKNCVNGLGE